MCYMQVLRLYNNKIGDVGLQAFADALGKGALASLEELSLECNQIGNAGLSALAEVVVKGALPKCTNIFTFDNPASDEAKQAVEDAIASSQ